MRTFTVAQIDRPAPWQAHLSYRGGNGESINALPLNWTRMKWRPLIMVRWHVNYRLTILSCRKWVHGTGSTRSLNKVSSMTSLKWGWRWRLRDWRKGRKKQQLDSTRGQSLAMISLFSFLENQDAKIEPWNQYSSFQIKRWQYLVFTTSIKLDIGGGGERKKEEGGDRGFLSSVSGREEPMRGSNPNRGPGLQFRHPLAGSLHPLPHLLLPDLPLHVIRDQTHVDELEPSFKFPLLFFVGLARAAVLDLDPPLVLLRHQHRYVRHSSCSLSLSLCKCPVSLCVGLSSISALLLWSVLGWS